MTDPKMGPIRYIHSLLMDFLSPGGLQKTMDERKHPPVFQHVPVEWGSATLPVRENFHDLVLPVPEIQ